MPTPPDPSGTDFFASLTLLEDVQRFWIGKLVCIKEGGSPFSVGILLSVGQGAYLSDWHVSIQKASGSSERYTCRSRTPEGALSLVDHWTLDLLVDQGAPTTHPATLRRSRSTGSFVADIDDDPPQIVHHRLNQQPSFNIGFYERFIRAFPRPTLGV